MRVDLSTNNEYIACNSQKYKSECKMLLSYSLENYKGFNEKEVLNLIATPSDEYQEQLYTLPNGAKVLMNAYIIGPNGSGKTHLLESLDRFTSVISFNDVDTLCDTFKLDKKNADKPSSFEVLLFNDSNERLYRYGLKVQKGNVLEEYLYSRTLAKGAKEKKLFTRSSNEFSFNREINSLLKLSKDISESSTFIRFAKAFKNTELEFVRDWALKNLLFRADYDVKNGIAFVENYLNNYILPDDDGPEIVENFFSICLKSMKSVGLPISEIKFLGKDNEKKIFFIHKGVTKASSVKISSGEAFDFFSKGSYNLISFIMFYWTAAFQDKNLLIDEFDGSLHYKVSMDVLDLIREFRSQYGKSKNQLFFVTHNIQLLDKNVRRDSVYIISKDNRSGSVITRASDFSLRKDCKISVKYLNNELGGLPRNIFKKDSD